MKFLGGKYSLCPGIDVIQAHLVDINCELQPLALNKADVISAGCTGGGEDVNGRAAISSPFVGRSCIMVGDTFAALVKILDFNGTGDTPWNSCERGLGRLNCDVK
jgi:hypothetical protein